MDPQLDAPWNSEARLLLGACISVSPFFPATEMIGNRFVERFAIIPLMMIVEQLTQYRYEYNHLSYIVLFDTIDPVSL